MWEVLNSRAASIRVEVPGFDGAEFYLQRTGHREYWQAKRQITNQETWTLRRLHREGVLRFFFEQFRAGQRCVFASVSESPELRVLIENAKAVDPDEFFAHFLSKERKNSFRQLQGFIGASDDHEVYRFLRSIELHGGREVTLEPMLADIFGAIFSGPGKTTMAVLRDLYLRSSHDSFTAADIERHLQDLGIKRREASAPGTRERIQATTRTYLTGQHAKLIRGKAIRRAQADEIVSKIADGSVSVDVLVTSGAGGGKSALLCQIAEGLQKVGVPVLAFRLDRVARASSPLLLGEALGLGESPAVSLVHAFGSQPVVLVIDQIDCVSTTSGRHSDFFDTLAALLDEIRGLRYQHRIHVVLACRKFDFDHDHRLRRLAVTDQSPIDLGEFSDNEVQSVVAGEGGEWGNLTPRQQAMLRLPQNLSLFVDAGLCAKPAGFHSQKELFDAYWNKKKSAVDRAGFGEHWMPLIRHIVGEMSARQELSLPVERLDDFQSEFLGCMASEGILNFDGRRYGFGHESFFDYCFARTLPNGGNDFVRLLEDDEQHLFRRAQLRQVLAFLRGGRFEDYLDCAREVLQSDKIRPHLKLLAVQLVTTQPEADDRELSLLLPWIESGMACRRAGERNPDRLASRIWDAFFLSRTLFPVADRMGLIQTSLNSGEPGLEDTMAVYLRRQAETHGGRVAELLEPFVARGGDWNKRLRHTMEWGNLEKDRRFFDLFLRLIDDGTLDEAKDRFAVNGTFWMMIHGLSGTRPGWCAELTAHWLDRRLKIATDSSSHRRHLRNDTSAVNHILKSAKASPKEFLHFVLPAILRTATAFTDTGRADGGLPRDHIWPLRHRSSHPDLAEALLGACENAFKKLGEVVPEADLRPSISLLQGSRLYTANNLLMNAYLGAPETFADEALALLSHEPERLVCGLTSSEYWVSYQVIENCSPHCSEPVFERLEEVLLAVAPPFEKTKKGLRWRGQAAYDLTKSLAESRTSSNAKARLAEWARKFTTPRDEPREIRMRPIQSPIGEEPALLMSDAQWLGAIQKYQNDRGIHAYDDPESGGARSLAGMLQSFTTAEPERFARLALHFPDSAHPSYFSNVLRGLKDAPIGVDLKIEVVRRIFPRTDHDCLCAGLELLGDLDTEVLPDDAVAFIGEMAVDHPDPPNDRLGDGSPKEGNDLVSDGMGSVRGHAVAAIRQWVNKDPRYLEIFTPIIVRTLSDRTLSVRSCVAHTLLAVARHDVSVAMRWLGQLLNADDLLLSTGYVVTFVQRGLETHFNELAPIIRRMLESDYDEVRNQGGILAGLARLHHQEAEPLANDALEGSNDSKLGICVVAKHNLLQPDCREWCEAVLIGLFNDDSPEIREQAGGCFLELLESPATPLSDFSSLIQAFLDSPSFAESPGSLLHALEELHSKLPDVTLNVCEAFMLHCTEKARDNRTAIAGDASTVSKLVFSAYSQLEKSASRERALRLIDEMTLEGLHGTEVQLADSER